MNLPPLPAGYPMPKNHSNYQRKLKYVSVVRLQSGGKKLIILAMCQGMGTLSPSIGSPWMMSTISSFSSWWRQLWHLSQIFLSVSDSAVFGSKEDNGYVIAAVCQRRVLKGLRQQLKKYNKYQLEQTYLVGGTHSPHPLVHLESISVAFAITRAAISSSRPQVLLHIWTVETFSKKGLCVNPDKQQTIFTSWALYNRLRGWSTKSRWGSPPVSRSARSLTRYSPWAHLILHAPLGRTPAPLGLMEEGEQPRSRPNIV